MTESDKTKKEQPNRYHLIAKPKDCKDINIFLKNKFLDASRVILIKVPLEEGYSNESSKEKLPKKLVNKVKGISLIEEATKTKLAAIDLFVLMHSKNRSADELRNYLNQELGYEIPGNYDFSIVYRRKDGEKLFRSLEPIYGNITTITNYLESFARTEYESRIYPQPLAQRNMQENVIWKNYYNKMIVEDIKTKTTLINLFSDWEDTRGGVDKKEKKASKEKFLEALRKQGQKNVNYLPTLEDQPLSVVMYACQIYPNNAYAQEVLKEKFSRYKDLRGYLLFRYQHFEKRKINEIEQELRKMKTGILKDQLVNSGIELLCMNDDPSLYELLRYTDYTIEDFLKYPLLESMLNNLLRSTSEWEYARLIERNIKAKKEKDEPNAITITTHQYSDPKGNTYTVHTYLEHEDYYDREDMEAELDSSSSTLEEKTSSSPRLKKTIQSKSKLRAR